MNQILKGLVAGGLLLSAGCSTNTNISPGAEDAWGDYTGKMPTVPAVKPAPKGKNGSRYALSQDDAPDMELHPSQVRDAVPRYEPIKKAGNKSPYTVWGKTYRVLPTPDGYVERGTASWYGKKFHGHKTSNGELFNMFAASAAHKSLPIPSFAQVTNLDNGKSIVVRVNDRGPFHGDRLIDLSYAAAVKLGYHTKGTANVEVRTIDVGQGSIEQGSAKVVVNPMPEEKVEVVSTPIKPATGNAYIQIGSFKNSEGAAKIAAKARGYGLGPIQVTPVDLIFGDLHRVQMGPMDSEMEARRKLGAVKNAGFHDAIVVSDGK